MLGCALVCAAPGTARAAEGSQVGLDLYFFGQRDPGSGRIAPGGIEVRGGNPLRAEGFDYGAGGIDFRVAVSDDVALVGNGVVGWIQDEGEHPIPDTVRSAQVISASPDLLTLDSSVGVAWQPGGGPWRLTPGFFYHHQKRYFVGGPNLDLSRSLFDGNTVLFGNAQVRAALIRQRGWDGEKRDEDWQVTASILVGWTQIWSPSWLTTLSAQYVRQSGRLAATWNYVALYDALGYVIRLVDESLPRVRQRGQINARVRYSPAVGWSFGLDGSFYADRWAVYHGSLEPSFEMPIGTQSRLRLWYRLSAQSGTKYFVDQPRELIGFYTQDSDLGSFWIHSPGALVTFPLPGTDELGWEGRLSTYGFYRTDRVFALGGHAGVAASW